MVGLVYNLDFFLNFKAIYMCYLFETSLSKLLFVFTATNYVKIEWNFVFEHIKEFSNWWLPKKDNFFLLP